MFSVVHFLVCTLFHQSLETHIKFWYDITYSAKNVTVEQNSTTQHLLHAEIYCCLLKTKEDEVRINAGRVLLLEYIWFPYILIVSLFHSIFFQGCSVLLYWLFLVQVCERMCFLVTMTSVSLYVVCVSVQQVCSSEVQCTEVCHWEGLWGLMPGHLVCTLI